MVLRNRVLAGPVGGVYLAASYLAGTMGVAGVMNQHDYVMWFAIPVTLTSLLLGWLIDQARWWFPVALAPTDDITGVDGMSPRQVRVACWLASVLRIVGVACCAAWTYHGLVEAISWTGGRIFW